MATSTETTVSSDLSSAGPSNRAALDALAPPSIRPPQPLRAAKQQRSKMLMRSVREATLELAGKWSPDDITTVKIAERAGISIGSLYRYYPNKEAIFTDIYREQLRATNERLRANLAKNRAHCTAEDLIREGVELTVQLHRELLALNAGFFVAFRRSFDFADLRGPDDATSESWNRWTERWLVDLMEKNRARLRVDDIAGAARFVMDMASGTIHHIVETRPDALAGDTLVRQLTELICGYLLAPRIAVTR